LSLGEDKRYSPEEIFSKFRNKIDANFLHKIQVFFLSLSLSLSLHTNEFCSFKRQKNTFISFVSRSKKNEHKNKKKNSNSKCEKTEEPFFTKGIQQEDQGREKKLQS